VKAFNYILGLFMLNLLLITESAVTKSAGPPACYSGEPPLQNSCISCHSQFPLNTGTAEIFLDLGMAENGFVQGQEYEITLGLKKGWFARWRFSIHCVI